MVCLETQRVRADHSSVLHHRRRDGPQVLKELFGFPGAQEFDVLHHSIVGLRDGGVNK